LPPHVISTLYPPDRNNFAPRLGFAFAPTRGWKHGKITDLGILEGGYESAAFAVNARGQVVGLATNAIPDPSSILGFSTQTRAVIGIMASILAARKLAQLESTKPCLNAIIADAVIFAARIMQRIDSAFPSARERIG